MINMNHNMNYKTILISILIFISTIVLLDRYLNLTRITPPVLKYYNEEFGALNAPNIDYLKFRESIFLGSTNYDGRFRENYPKKKADSSILRIVLIGDSFVEGIDVFGRDHFAAYMERLISKELNRKVEILNFGRGNCTLQASSFYFLNYIKKEYDVDLALYFVEARDVSPVTDYPSTAFTVDEATENLVPSYSWNESQDYKLTKMLSNWNVLSFLNSSGIFRLTYRARSGLIMYGFWPKVLGKVYGEIPTQSYNFTKQNDEVSKISTKIFDTLSKQTNPKVLFVIRNFPIESSNLENFMDKMSYRHVNLKDTFDNKLIRNTKDDAFYFKATGLYGGHWNHLGHKAVGYFLSNKVINAYREGEIK